MNAERSVEQRLHCVRTVQAPGAIRSRRRHRAVASALGAVCVLASTGAGAAARVPVSVLEVWIRGAPPAPVRQRLRRMPLTGRAALEVERRDVQYDDPRRFRGVPLDALLRSYAPPAALDLALLRFANGMVIPLPFRDQAVMARLQPFVATATATADGVFPLSPVFPAVAKKDVAADPRPIQFTSNKLVVAERWHPDVPPQRQPVLSPWVHADTLMGIELVAAHSYYDQFDVAADASARRGLALFRENCQFCHRVGAVGATFGSDLLAIVSDGAYRESPPHLFHNVAFKPRNAPELGLMMPALSFLSEEEAGHVLAWLRAFEGRPMPAYRRPR